jgi:glycosyltransferase involved in cell wall biosynthesis
LYLCWQGGLLEWLESWQPEVLVMEANPRYLRTTAAVRWMHARRRPVIGWGLGAPAGRGWLEPLRRTARCRFLRQFDALITYSHKGAQEYQQAGFAPERIFVAPNAVSARPLQPIPPRPPNFKDGRPTVLFVGRLQARKRVDLLLRACAALPQDLRPALWIVGDGPERPALEAQARRTYPATQFFGSRQGAALEPFFLSADLFVLPGTGGLAIQQAMTYGLPVIAAEADGTQEDLVRPQNGWQIPSGDLNALLAALQQALSDPSRLRRMGEASYQIVTSEINLERMVAVFAQAVAAVGEG